MQWKLRGGGTNQLIIPKCNSCPGITGGRWRRSRREAAEVCRLHKHLQLQKTTLEVWTPQFGGRSCRSLSPQCVRLQNPLQLQKNPLYSFDASGRFRSHKLGTMFADAKTRCTFVAESFTLSLKASICRWKSISRFLQLQGKAVAAKCTFAAANLFLQLQMCTLQWQKFVAAILELWQRPPAIAAFFFLFFSFLFSNQWAKKMTWCLYMGTQCTCWYHKHIKSCSDLSVLIDEEKR